MEERRIEKYPRWSRAKEKLMEDSRYSAVPSSFQRELWFNEYMSSQTASANVITLGYRSSPFIVFV